VGCCVQVLLQLWWKCRSHCRIHSKLLDMDFADTILVLSILIKVMFLRVTCCRCWCPLSWFMPVCLSDMGFVVSRYQRDKLICFNDRWNIKAIIWPRFYWGYHLVWHVGDLDTTSFFSFSLRLFLFWHMYAVWWMYHLCFPKCNFVMMIYSFKLSANKAALNDVFCVSFLARKFLWNENS
jgi:hypothetical protein